MKIKQKATAILVLFALSACQIQEQVKSTLDDFAFGNGAGYMRGFKSPSNNNNSETSMNNGNASNGNKSGQGFGYQNNDILNEKLTTLKIADSLSDQEKSDLFFMREEEKVARDFYISMYEKYKQKSFDNISKSEQFHMDAIKLLLDRYKLEDPVTNNANGVFKDKKLKDLYDGLVKDGNLSLESALKLGAKVEEIDIKDLKSSINNAKSEDLKLVYDYLLSASENHLRSFTGNLTKFYSLTYIPQVLSKEEYDAVVK